MKSRSGVANKITGDNCKRMDKRRDGHGHGDGSSPILHQEATRPLTSPLYNDTFHLTGVYIFPDKDQLRDFFDTLATNSNHSHNDPRLYAEDSNTYTAEELENHVTPTNYAPSLAAREKLTLLISLPLTSFTAPAVDYRGRLLLNMINSLEIVSINANGYFSVPPSSNRPCTFSQKPNTHSILNYNLIEKNNVPLIQTCKLLLTLSQLVSQPICPSTSTSNGKLVDNFSHESDVTSLQDPFTSRAYNTPFYFCCCVPRKIPKGIFFQIHVEYSPFFRLLVSSLAFYATAFRLMFPWL